ncbi:MAG: type II secretion system protein, partial [Phycisphaerae bacterium]|nr:type II secretion system protein [Phycisphaerae bacterium]
MDAPHWRGTRIAPSSAAFTLVEILVVLAIIGLLIAIVVPSIATARAKARLVCCASNLREIGRGLFLYADQAADMLPLNSGETWKEAWAVTEALGISAGTDERTWVGILQTTLGRDSAPWLAPLRCPQSGRCPPDDETVGDVNSRPGAGWYLNAYCRGRLQSSIPTPSDGVLVMETASW